MPESKEKNKFKGVKILKDKTIEEYDDLIGKNIKKYLDGKKIATTIKLTAPILDAYNTPELKRKLSEHCRILLSQHLISNGYDTEIAQEKLKRVKNLRRELQSMELALEESITDIRTEELEAQKLKAKEIQFEEEFIAYMRDCSIEYKQKEKDKFILSKEPKDVKIYFINYIDTTLRPRIMQMFNKDMAAEDLYKMLGLGQQK